MTTDENPTATVHSLNEAREKKLQATRRRLIGLKEVEDRCRMKKSAIYAGMAAGTFPRCFRLPYSRSVAWEESQIDSWIDAVVAANSPPQPGESAAVDKAASTQRAVPVGQRPVVP